MAVEAPKSSPATAYGRWQGHLKRPTLRVQPVATTRGTLHLDVVVLRHPRGQQSDQRIPASTMF